MIGDNANPGILPRTIAKVFEAIKKSEDLELPFTLETSIVEERESPQVALR